ncbi:HNH endonuclease [Kitasatospora sp. NPDC001309]|uniref:HNH endonuclease n=1 Tax=Kitasatospora sp. NPDC001309 TaxID=3364013 RepID=UPI0036971577
MCKRCHRLINLGNTLCEACSPISAPRKARIYKSKNTRVKGAYDATWVANVKAAIARQPYCSWCMTRGNKDNPLTGDHIKPRSKGGGNELSNIRVLCRACNSRRGNKT